MSSEDPSKQSKLSYFHQEESIDTPNTIDQNTDNSVTLEYCGCVSINRGGEDNQHLYFPDFSLDIVESLAETDYFREDLDAVGAADDLVDDGTVSPDEDIDIGVEFEKDARSGIVDGRRNPAYVGNIQVGQDIPDGRNILDNRKLTGDCDQINLSEEVLPKEGYPWIINLWAGDGRVALEYAGCKATIKERKVGMRADYYLQVGHNSKDTQYADNINHYEQFCRCVGGSAALAGNRDIHPEYGNHQNKNRIVMKIYTHGDSNELKVDCNDSIVETVKIDITEKQLRQLGLNPDNSDGQTVRINPYHRTTQTESDIEKETMIQSFIIEPEMPHGGTTQIAKPQPQLRCRDDELSRDTVISSVKQAANELKEPLSAREYREWASEESGEEMRTEKQNSNVPMGGEETEVDVATLTQVCRQYGFAEICKAADIETQEKVKITKIQNELYHILDELGIEYTVEGRIEKPHTEQHSYRADAWVPSEQIVVEADGDYWHAHPDKGGDVEQRKNWVHGDELRNRRMKTRGYGVVRVWGSSINQSRGQVKEELERIIVSGGEYKHGNHILGPEPTITPAD